MNQRVRENRLENRIRPNLVQVGIGLRSTEAEGICPGAREELVEDMVIPFIPLLAHHTTLFQQEILDTRSHDTTF